MKNKNITSKLIHRIVFLVNRAPNAIADPVWEEFCVSFAEVKPICDNRFVSLEGVDFGNLITEEYFLFKTRFIKNLNKEMRKIFHDRNFEIKLIIDQDEKGRMLNIVALEV